MDSIDDLLAARHSLEDNPFQSPFENNRSGSPDPWASYRIQAGQDAYEPTNADSDQPFRDTFTDNSPFTNNVEHTAKSAEPKDIPDGLNILPQSPGFRESVSPQQSPTFREKAINPELDTIVTNATTVDKASRSSSTSPPSKLRSSTPSRSRSPTTPKLRPVDAHNSPVHSPASPINPARAGHLISPLDNAVTSLDSSFASLAMGGESVGGWQDSESASSAFVNEQVNSAASNISTTSIVQKDILISQPLPILSNITQKDGVIEPLFAITVDDPQKVGDPIRPYIMYTVHTRTSSPLYSKSSFSVLRRYSDFLWLWDTLSLNNPGVFVPPVPEKSSFGRFESQFIQQRRVALQKCVRKIANHPTLAKDPDLKLFLESDSFALDIKHRKAELAQERGGLMSTFSQTIAGPKFYEMDDWFDTRRSYLDGLETQLRAMVKAIEVVSKQRAELAIATGEFAAAVGELAGSDLNGKLSQSLTMMSEVEKRASELEHLQEQEDIMTFMSTADEYARLISSIRYAFTSRVRLHAHWQNAEGEVRRVKQNHERNRSQGRPVTDRLGYSLSQVAEAERKAVDAKNEFEQCSKLIKSEMARFEDERVHNFKDSLEEFLGGMIMLQKELISEWEKFQDHLLRRNTNATTHEVSNGFI